MVKQVVHIARLYKGDVHLMLRKVPETVICIECGKPIKTSSNSWYWSKCKGSRACGKTIKSHTVFIHKSCYEKLLNKKG